MWLCPTHTKKIMLGIESFSNSNKIGLRFHSDYKKKRKKKDRCIREASKVCANETSYLQMIEEGMNNRVVFGVD